MQAMAANRCRREIQETKPMPSLSCTPPNPNFINATKHAAFEKRPVAGRQSWFQEEQ